MQAIAFSILVLATGIMSPSSVLYVEEPQAVEVALPEDGAWVVPTGVFRAVYDSSSRIVGGGKVKSRPKARRQRRIWRHGTQRRDGLSSAATVLKNCLRTSDVSFCA